MCIRDRTYFGLEYLQQDLCNIMEKLVPTCRVENQYMHPGPKHVEFGDSVGEPGPWTSLNTDAHLRSCFFGRSESIAIEAVSYTHLRTWINSPSLKWTNGRTM